MNSIIFNSRWRTDRLLILCYHGLALDDEAEWRPTTYFRPALFRARMELLRRLDCTVLPLDEGIHRLYANQLPPRAVSITFDDGGYDFYQLAYPILREYGLPATVYLTTYYSVYQRPVFDVMLSYLLWKRRNETLAYSRFLTRSVHLDVKGREFAEMAIRSGAYRLGLSGREKDALLAELAGCLGLNYEALCAKRILQLMTLAEARELAAKGIDIQLHTHHHRVPRVRERFIEEIEANRHCISQVSRVKARHFCYPCGYNVPEFRDFLDAAGVESATTCEPGMASPQSDRYFLPRFLDAGNVAEAEFVAWVSGLRAFLPRRARPPLHAAVVEQLAPTS